MSRPFINVIIALVTSLVMCYQMWRAPANSHKRHAFIAAGLAFGLLALFNGAVLLHGDSETRAIVVLWIAFLLLFTSVALLFLSWRAGEMQEQVEHVLQAFKRRRPSGAAQEPVAARAGEEPPQEPENTSHPPH